MSRKSDRLGYDSTCRIYNLSFTQTRILLRSNFHVILERERGIEKKRERGGVLRERAGLRERENLEKVYGEGVCNDACENDTC